MVLVMSVEPGLGGQKFISSVLDKCRAIRKVIDKNGYDCELEIDGGISAKNSKEVVESGCSVLVAGSAIFGAEDVKKAIEDIRRGE